MSTVRQRLCRWWFMVASQFVRRTRRRRTPRPVAPDCGAAGGRPNSLRWHYPDQVRGSAGVTRTLSAVRSPVGCEVVSLTLTPTGSRAQQGIRLTCGSDRPIAGWVGFRSCGSTREADVRGDRRRSGGRRPGPAAARLPAAQRRVGRRGAARCTPPGCARTRWTSAATRPAPGRRRSADYRIPELRRRRGGGARRARGGRRRTWSATTGARSWPGRLAAAAPRAGPHADRGVRAASGGAWRTRCATDAEQQARSAVHRAVPQAGQGGEGAAGATTPPRCASCSPGSATRPGWTATPSRCASRAR